MKKLKIIFTMLSMAILFGCSVFCFSGCDNSKGKYFVSEEYIMAHAYLSSTTTSNDSIEYGINISHESDITLSYIIYECNLYKNNKIIETFNGEVPMNELYSMYIPLKTTNEFDYAKAICTGWSDENPEKFIRLRAKSKGEMLKCNHSHTIEAKINSLSTDGKQEYMILNFTSQTAYNDFKFMYDYFKPIYGDVNVCMECGYYTKMTTN